MREPISDSFTAPPWAAAQAENARALAEAAFLLGALDARVRDGPSGWRQRLALRTVDEISWWAGDRLGLDRIALWVLGRQGVTDDRAQGLARAAWALRRLQRGQAPAVNPAGFLDRQPTERRDPGADLAALLAAGQGLHPLVDAARLFFGWSAYGGEGAIVPMEAAVLAACRGASGCSAVASLPLSVTGFSGSAENRLARWLEGIAQGLRSALRELDQIAAWRRAADTAIADLSGRTPGLLLNVLEGVPHVSAPLAEAQTKKSRAAVQRNFLMFEDRGVVREVTRQSRYRLWTARL